MPHGANSVVVRYALKGSFGRRKQDTRLHLRPLLSFVDYHALQKQNDDFGTGYEVGENVVSVRPYAEMPRLDIYFSGGGPDPRSATGALANSRATDTITPTGHWYRNFQCAIEAERGFDFQEDLYQPFELSLDLTKPVDIVATTY
jgi:hypothetical protein